MEWERRGNRRYYYRKRRIGDKVDSEYVGRGPLAELLAEEDECERQSRIAEQRRKQAARAEVKAIDDELDDYGDMVRTLTRAVLLANGYHPHKGQWRKKRNE